MDAATSVPLNAKLSASFDLSMAPLGATSFMLKQGTTNVAGAVATTADGMTATFAPATALP